MDKTLVIAISQSGKGKDIFEVVKKANEKGALTLSITNNEKSIVAIESKYDLYNNVDEAVELSAKDKKKLIHLNRKRPRDEAAEKQESDITPVIKKENQNTKLIVESVKNILLAEK